MILHLCVGTRFVPYFHQLFEAENPGENTFVIGQVHPDQPTGLPASKQVVTYTFGGSKKLRQQIAAGSWQLVIVHFMDPRWWELIRLLPQELPVIWIFWGGDAYNLPLMRENMFGSMTTAYAKKMNSKGLLSNFLYKMSKLRSAVEADSFWSWDFVIGLYYEFQRQRQTSFEKLDNLRLQCFDRVDYCGTFLKEDYELFQQLYPFKMKWVDARFIGLDQLKIALPEKPGRNILLGNSCTLENNHLEALQQLAGLDLDGRRVLCPLSYGKDRSPAYIGELTRVGKAAVGDAFDPLLEFMPLAQYNELVGTCGIAIMNHYRQQAFNNLLVLVYQGTKVFLNKQNTIYSYFKRLGIYVFDMSSLDEDGALEPLTESERVHNRTVLIREFGAEAIRKSTNNLLKLVINP